ncbi:unnamed protein product [Protopolystoma xenopodis]|uniref:Uncharacterized protein n=1 Tax=Protopolystoma xenopodis TaxID=117903 RepID=A0A448XM36_9PLAT|nr:unnamed protein product [Protopolystoma xenopodis]
MYCALASDLVPGAYYSDCAYTPPSKLAESKEVCSDVWKATSRLIRATLSESRELDGDSSAAKA